MEYVGRFKEICICYSVSTVSLVTRKAVCLGKPSRRDGQNIAAGDQVKLKSEERRPMAHRPHERTCLTRYVVGLFRLRAWWQSG
jgi:hypothetical protein